MGRLKGDSLMMEDLAQWTKDSITVDFGYYGHPVIESMMEFGIYVVKDNDWTNYLCNLRINDANTALSLLLCIPYIFDSNISK